MLRGTEYPLGFALLYVRLVKSVAVGGVIVLGCLVSPRAEGHGYGGPARAPFTQASLTKMAQEIPRGRPFRPTVTKSDTFPLKLLANFPIGQLTPGLESFKMSACRVGNPVTDRTRDSID